MAITYEINPPRLPDGPEPPKSDLGPLLAETVRRVSEIADICDGIHITESVLGTNRISPIATADAIRSEHPGVPITTSMRVIDRTMDGVRQYVQCARESGINSILVLMGDRSPNQTTPSQLVPSRVASDLGKGGNDPKIFLSLPASPNLERIRKKIDARPAGFVTQVIQSTKQVSMICDALMPQGFEIIPVVLLPSTKNLKSASLLNLDWSGYEDAAGEFIESVQRIAGNVLVTSPNDYNLARRTLEDLHTRTKRPQ